MKVSKRLLVEIIREEKRKLLEESGGVGIGFSGWSVNKNPDFAKAYGKDARVLRDFGSNQQLQEQRPSEEPDFGRVDAHFEQAIDNLDMDLRNALANAVEAGLIIDDLDDAWENARAFVEEQLMV